MSKKEAYVAKAQAKISEQSAKLDELKAKVKGQVADQKIEAYEHIEKLELKLDAAKSRLAEISDSTEERWQDCTVRYETLTEEFGASIKKFFGK